MAIALGNALTTGNSTTNSASSYTSAVLTNAPGAGNLVIGFVCGDDTGLATPSLTSVTGGGITTWQIHATNVPFTNGATAQHAMFMVYAQQSGAGGTGAITMTFSSAILDGCNWVFFELTGVSNETATNGTNAIVQTKTAKSDANVSSITGSDLATPTTGNALICGVDHSASEDATVRTNWTQVAAFTSHATPVSGIKAEWTNTLETSYGMSWATASKVGAIAAEIKAVVAATPGPNAGDRRRELQQLYVGMAS